MAATVNVLPAQSHEKPLDWTDYLTYGWQIGELLYLLISTRPDINFSASSLVRSVHALTSRHIDLIQKAFR